MKTNLPFLFDPSKFERLKTPDQKQFETANLNLMLAFEDIVYDAHDQFHNKVLSLFKWGEMDKMLPAVAMISFIRQSFIRDYPSYCREATNQRFRLITDNGEYIYLKKLDDNKKPSNIETQSNNLILYQVTDDSSNKRPNVFFGYTTTEEYSKITGVYAVCLKGEQLMWVTNISNLRSSMGGLVATVTTPTEPVLKPGIVKLKKKNQTE